MNGHAQNDVLVVIIFAVPVAALLLGVFVADRRERRK
jgi:hypothetical protein